MGAGIRPSVLASQVENTAAWALADPRCAEPAGVVRNAPAQELSKTDAQSVDSYFTLLLAAHHLTVATFVPTDVDARIRHHHWVEIEEEGLSRSIEILRKARDWDKASVTARTVDVNGSLLCGHDGEWLSVIAGALGRALELDSVSAVDACKTWIDEEVVRHKKAFEGANDALSAFRISTVIAHNLGDLSRVVEAWPVKAKRDPCAERYKRLGHERSEQFGASLARAGDLNKAWMAKENHRFLPLRKVRALRASRDLLLPIGPFFFDWGRMLASHSTLSDEDRAGIVDALLEIHERNEHEMGCLRALAGMHQFTKGGTRLLGELLPARRRKLLTHGKVRDALDAPEDAFLQKLERGYAKWLNSQ